MKTIYENEKKCPNTFLDIYLVGIKNRNCLEPSSVNYCSAIKNSPNIDGFSLFSDYKASEGKSNSMYLFFKYVSGNTIAKAQREIVCFSNLFTFGSYFSKNNYDFSLKS